MLSEYLDHATPAQVVVQVLRGDPVEASHPFLQSRMVGVRILDVVDAGQDSDPLAEIHRPMGHTHIAGRQSDGSLSSSVRAKNRIPSQKRSEDRFDLPVVVLRKNRIGGGARPVSHHQDRHLFPGEPSFGGSAASFPGPSRKPAPLSLVGFQEPGLVGFDDSVFRPGLEIGGQGQKSVPPQKGGFRVDPTPPGRLPDRLPFTEFLQKEQPAVLVMKTRKGRVRQGTKGALAPLAPVPWKAGRMPPRPDLRMVTTGTGRGDSDQGDDLGDQVLLVSPLDFHLKIVPLSRCHGTYSSKTSLECMFIHGNHLLNQAYP